MNNAHNMVGDLKPVVCPSTCVELKTNTNSGNSGENAKTDEKGKEGEDGEDGGQGDEQSKAKAEQQLDLKRFGRAWR